MSRAKAKLCKIEDLQGRLQDCILTKKDCDMIAKALEMTYPFKEIQDLYWYFHKLGYAHLVKPKNLLL